MPGWRRRAWLTRDFLVLLVFVAERLSMVSVMAAHGGGTMRRNEKPFQFIARKLSAILGYTTLRGACILPHIILKAV